MDVIGVFRPVSDEDIIPMLEWRNHPKVRVNMYNRAIIEREEHLRWWQKTLGNDSKRYFIYEINGEACGVVAFTGIDIENKRADWAFYAAPHARRGTGSKMEFLALSYAFDSLMLNKLCCEVLAFNKGVLKLHQRFGFSVEGILRSHHFYDGRFEDVYLFGLLKSEWDAVAPVMKETLTNHCGI